MCVQTTRWLAGAWRCSVSLSGFSAVFLIAAALLVQAPAAMAQGQSQTQSPQSTSATLLIPQGETVTLVINGVSQTFSSGDTIDLSQNIAVPANATVSFELNNGATIAPDGGSTFSVAVSGTSTTVSLENGSASVATTTTANTVTISNGNGVSISGTDVSSSFNAATQETTVEVNSGTATLSGSATNGTKTFVANDITLTASDDNQKVFSVSFDDGANQDTASGFQTATTPTLAPIQTPVVQPPVVTPVVVVINIPTQPAQTDTASPAAP